LYPGVQHGRFETLFLCLDRPFWSWKQEEGENKPVWVLLKDLFTPGDQSPPETQISEGGTADPVRGES